MTSRMDRYHKEEFNSLKRSNKNKSLYKQIQDLDSYTNIESVTTIEKTNEIDISKVQEMLRNRENYKKQKQLKNILKEEVQEILEIPKEEEEIKNYDINEMISKIKSEKPKIKSEYRKLKEEHYAPIKNLNNKFDIEKEEKELQELLNTITSNKALNDLSNTSDVGLLDELKSNTMVGDASSIKKLIEEEKQNKINEDTMEMDKSFYTSSFGFTQSDFEELKDMNHKIKKGNKFIIVLLIIIILLIIAGIIFFIIKNK